MCNGHYESNCGSYEVILWVLHTGTVKASKGVKHGDPLSLYLFILVSQNLSKILNFAMNKGFIPGFDSR